MLEEPSLVVLGSRGVLKQDGLPAIVAAVEIGAGRRECRC